jgi:hypothetical protein
VRLTHRSLTKPSTTQAALRSTPPALARQRRRPAAGLVTLASAQSLVTLDSSVMSVSMATVANELCTSINGIQTVITLYSAGDGDADDHYVKRPTGRTRACRWKG